VAFISQATVKQVLKYHYDWMTVTGFTTEQGRWFYALLTCLEKPLEPEACSLLRDLARACSSVRATLESAEDPCLAPLNLLICLVARYFSQADLADPG
jgi:survival of motor neuron protein-interacting protein 1